VLFIFFILVLVNVTMWDAFFQDLYKKFKKYITFFNSDKELIFLIFWGAESIK